MHRPKNPFNPAAITARNTNGKPISHYDAYEEGADAMLEVLRKKGEDVIMKLRQLRSHPVIRPEKGYLVFIPEEE